MKHDFHFVLNKKLKDQIVIFSNINNMSISGSVVYIFNLMKPFIEKHYLMDLICEKNGYSYSGCEVDIHVYFDKTDYKYLKQVQSNLYCFSMAMVLRWVLNEFFAGFYKFGLDRFCEVVRRFKGYFFKRSKYSSACSKRHMFACTDNFNYIWHIFDRDYNLINTKFT